MIVLLWTLCATASPTVPWLTHDGDGVAVRLVDDAPVQPPLAALLRGARTVGATHQARLQKLLRTLPVDTPDPRQTHHLQTADPAALVDLLLTYDAVQYAWITTSPAPPPVDISPTTPDLSGEQTWALWQEGGMGMRAAHAWPGGRGEQVVLADVELDFDPEHEDLSTQAPFVHSGQPYALDDWAFHGNAVLSTCCAADDGYGVTGGAPLATAWVLHPVYDDQDDYRPADAIIAATLDLAPGDVLLLELQTFGAAGLLPITAEPDVWDAVSLATAAGITVVVPAANGAQDLDSPDLEGWFDRSTHDDGAILVGAIDPEDGEWSRSGYGEAVDVHGWDGGIAAATDGSFFPDLFFPDDDDRQAYTSRFGGTSGAAAQVASAVAIAQSVSLTVHGEPMQPRDLRTWLRLSGRPQEEHLRAERPIGSYPDVPRLLQACMSP